jgi:hypothetical protein
MPMLDRFSRCAAILVKPETDSTPIGDVEGFNFARRPIFDLADGGLAVVKRER